MIAAIIMLGIPYSMFNFAFAISFSMLNNSCNSKQRAMANGISQVVSGVLRLLAPIYACNIFSFTVNLNKSYFFNYRKSHFSSHF